jgi:ATP-dependent DNA helicase RecG
MIGPEELDSLLRKPEDERLEFKEAKRGFHFDKLASYCVALANEGGGRLVLGVTDKRPRKVVGTSAFPSLGRTKHKLLNAMHFRVEAEAVRHSDGRVVIFDVPSRPVGMPVQYKGRFLMRSGSSVVPMSADQLRRIYEEGAADFSAEICDRATLQDLDRDAVDEFRRRWARKSNNESLAKAPVGQLLADAELVMSEGVTNAAVILLGRQRSLGRLFPQAEVILEYRSSEAAGPAQERADYRKGFLLFADELWQRISLRNEVQHFQDGLFVEDIPTFGQASVREAILNAVTHRDYGLRGSVIIRQFQRRIEVVSPGGFPPGVTADNILWNQSWRNRRIAETFQKCGLVERAGQGVNRIFEESIRQGKPRPDFSRSDDYQVFLSLEGEVQDIGFLRLLERVGRERLRSFATEHFLVLDLVHREQRVPEPLRPYLSALIEDGVVESVGRGRGTRYLLSRRYYTITGRRGTYTRKRGLDRAQNRQLLLQHIRKNAAEGVRLAELRQVLPALSRGSIQSLLKEIKADELVECRGHTRGARWYPVERQD